MSEDVKILGAVKLIKSLSGIDRALQKQAIKEGLNKAGDIAERKAKELAPKETGKLAESIKKGKVKKRKNKQTITVGSKDPKAINVEYGTSDTPENSYLRKALKQVEEEIIYTFQQAVITDVIKGLSK